jgi:hypothetical protein
LREYPFLQKKNNEKDYMWTRWRSCCVGRSNEAREVLEKSTSKGGYMEEHGKGNDLYGRTCSIGLFHQPVDVNHLPYLFYNSS